MGFPVGSDWKEWEKKKQDLLKYCLEEEWKKVVDIYENHPIIQTAKLTASEETALHIAVSEGKEDIVKRLVEVTENPQATLSIRNYEGNTPLHLAALIGNVGICKCIVEKNEELLDCHNYKGETPLFLAALRGQNNAFLYLDQITDERKRNKYYRRLSDDRTILHVAISGQYFELAYHILLLCKCDDEIIGAVDDQGYTALHLLASNPAVFRSGSRPDGFINRIIYHWELKNTENYPENYKTVSVTDRDGLPAPSRKHMEANKQRIEELEEGIRYIPQNQVHILVLLFGLRDKRNKVKEKKKMNIWSVQILNLMLRKSSHHDQPRQMGGDDGKSEKYFIGNRGFRKRRDTPILIAARNGIIEMVERILQVFPMAILDKDPEGNNIVLLSVKNRQTKLYELLVNRKPRDQSAFNAIDVKGNSVLHVAATLGNLLPALPFCGIQMQWEIKWFKYVKQSVPRGFFVSRNNENKTSKEVFMESHEDLVREGGKWLKETSNYCSVVATLITTVAFATTATVPSGMKEGSGRPNLERHPGFIVFAISSLIALAFSVTSTVAFLSILTSRYHQKDFRRDLPRKLLWALTSLFISLAAMLVCFCAAHFVLVEDEFEHSGYLVIYAMVCLPIAYFAMMQFPFYFALILQTFKHVPQRTPFG